MHFSVCFPFHFLLQLHASCLMMQYLFFPVDAAKSVISIISNITNEEGSEPWPSSLTPGRAWMLGVWIGSHVCGSGEQWRGGWEGSSSAERGPQVFPSQEIQGPDEHKHCREDREAAWRGSGSSSQRVRMSGQTHPEHRAFFFFYIYTWNIYFFFKIIFIVILLELLYSPPFGLLHPSHPPLSQSIPTCCPCPWVIHTCSLTLSFPFFPPLACSPLPSGNCPLVPYSCVSHSFSWLVCFVD